MGGPRLAVDWDRPDLDDIRDRLCRVAETGCWHWTRARTRGYATAWWRGRTRYVHQLLLEHRLGRPLRSGMETLHRCHRGRDGCVNPDHLFEGDHRTNTDMALADGRTAKGEDNAAAALTAADVPVIRRLAAEGLTQRSIARRYGVTQPTIHYLLAGKTWRHVPVCRAGA